MTEGNQPYDLRPEGNLELNATMYGAWNKVLYLVTAAVIAGVKCEVVPSASSKHPYHHRVEYDNTP